MDNYKMILYFVLKLFLHVPYLLMVSSNEWSYPIMGSETP